MSLDKLPLELIHEIASHLPKKDVISLGLRTHNKHIFGGCERLLKRNATAKKFEKRMMKRFEGEPYRHRYYLLSPKEYQNLELAQKFGLFIDDHSASLEFMDIWTGNMDWVAPVEEQPRPVKETVYYRHNAQYLETRADELGVKLPKAFMAWNADEKLPNFVSLGYDIKCVHVEDGFRKCIPSLQKGAEAYMINFYQDVAGCTHSLYLDPELDGGYCVLLSDYSDLDFDEMYEEGDMDWDLFSDEEVAEFKAILGEGKFKPAWSSSDRELRSCDFDEWLALEHIHNCFYCAVCEQNPLFLGPMAEEFARVSFGSTFREGA